MAGEDFTFAGVEQALTNGLTTIVAAASIVGLILILILLISLGWNYFKLLLETVERYIVVGVLCYTSPLAFSMGASKSTNNVFKSWCRMVGSQLLLLVMNVWFLRGFASSMGQFIGNGGALSTGQGSIFLWMFCALAYLKCAQRFDSYLASMGLSVAQTGSSMGMELLMAARVISGVGSGAKSAGSVFGRAGGSATATGTGAAATGFAAGFASRFNPNSYVRDAVVDGGSRMGFSGGTGFVGRVFGGMAARNGATLNGQSISSVASRAPGGSGTIAGDIADRSLSNYLPHMKGFQLKGTHITGGHISTTATTPDGKKANVDLYSAAQYEKPDVPHSVVTAADGSQWYQVASGDGRGAFYDAPVFGGMNAQAAGVVSMQRPAQVLMFPVYSQMLPALLWLKVLFPRQMELPMVLGHSRKISSMKNLEPPTDSGLKDSFPEVRKYLQLSPEVLRISLRPQSLTGRPLVFLLFLQMLLNSMRLLSLKPVQTAM